MSKPCISTVVCANMESKGDISDQMATKRIAITIAFSLMSFFSVAGEKGLNHT